MFFSFQAIRFNSHTQRYLYGVLLLRMTCNGIHQFQFTIYGDIAYLLIVPYNFHQTDEVFCNHKNGQCPPPTPHMECYLNYHIAAVSLSRLLSLCVCVTKTVHMCLNRVRRDRAAAVLHSMCPPLCDDRGKRTSERARINNQLN